MRGFSLIEVLIVLAILGFVASMGTIFSMSSLSRSYALSERDLLVALLLIQNLTNSCGSNPSPNKGLRSQTLLYLYQGIGL